MIEILSVENMRKSDAWTIANRIPGRELMLRAGQRIFESVDWQGPVAIVCGGKLHALYEPRGQRLACKAMIPGGVMGVRL